MGGGSSKKDGVVSRTKSKKIKEVHNLVLLGTGGAGKSTIFKAIKIAKKGGFTEHEREQHGIAIFRGLVKVMKGLLETVDESSDSAASVKAADLDALPEDTKQLREHLAAVWASDAIKAAFRENEGTENDPHEPSTRFIFKNFDRMNVAGFQSTDDDILQFRLPTTDFSTIDYDANDDVTLRFIDVGGQRKERIKWNSLPECTAVIFVAALNDYNKKLAEDATRNRLHESITLLRVLATKHFANTDIILFLNKRDLFEELIKTVDLKCCFMDYDGGCNYDPALKRIVEGFKKVCADGDLHVNVTCATDINQMDQTIQSMQEVVLKKLLNSFLDMS